MTERVGLELAASFVRDMPDFDTQGFAKLCRGFGDDHIITILENLTRFDSPEFRGI